MKIGVLLLFRNNEKTINVEQFTNLFVEKIKLHVCFVNNGSTDETLTLLKEIQEETSIPISIIDVKKNRGQHAAMKAGIRYLTSKNDLPYIICLKKYTSEDIKILEKVLQRIQQEKSVVHTLFHRTNRMLYKNVFSLRGILEKAS